MDKPSTGDSTDPSASIMNMMKKMYTEGKLIFCINIINSFFIMNMMKKMYNEG